MTLFGYMYEVLLAAIFEQPYLVPEKVESSSCSCLGKVQCT